MKNILLVLMPLFFSACTKTLKSNEVEKTGDKELFHLSKLDARLDNICEELEVKQVALLVTHEKNTYKNHLFEVNLSKYNAFKAIIDSANNKKSNNQLIEELKLLNLDGVDTLNLEDYTSIKDYLLQIKVNLLANCVDAFAER